jgi:peptidoglycan hydrolase-like protein with peptidoglycan-binding domain
MQRGFHPSAADSKKEFAAAQRPWAPTAAQHAAPDRDHLNGLSTANGAAAEPALLSPETATALQRTAGNRAVSRLVEARSRPGRAAVPRVQRVGGIITPAPNAGTSAHPTLTKGATNNPEAVSEAQQKLATSPGGPATLVANGVFNDDTEAAVKAFRKKNGLSESGVVDKDTWERLDAQGKSSVGRVERKWNETLNGINYGMTSKYSYKIDDKKIIVSVGINFVADSAHPPKDLAAVVAKWKTRILGRWNLFKAVKDGGGGSRDIEFNIVATGGNTVTVIDANVGSDAGHWSVPDNEHDNGPAHEFGHMIGLADEYKQTLAEYQRLHPGATADQVKKAKGAYYGGDQYTDETSMMGMGALKDHSDKAADPEPRHVREFVGFVEKFLGGTWEAAKK